MAETMVYEDDMATLLADEDALTELNASTRCDRCGARAVVATVKPDHTELLWCLHHYKAKEFALAEAGWFVTLDVRDSLVSKESGVHA